MFGVERIKQIIEDSAKLKYSIFDEIIKQNSEFRGNREQQDDLTLVEITKI
jgi:serine phosphatase RsbU (regulator of sigma subunit)